MLTLNVASSVGFIALFGVAVENAIIMVSHLNRLRDTGIPPYLAVLTGAGERLRPILLTASVASVGIRPPRARSPSDGPKRRAVAGSCPRAGTVTHPQ
jgi:Cu/Ag efflux pump CusA